MVLHLSVFLSLPVLKVEGDLRTQWESGLLQMNIMLYVQMQIFKSKGKYWTDSYLSLGKF